MVGWSARHRRAQRSRRFVLTDDIERLTSAPPATGIRLLPPRDPYLLDRDRTALVPDREWQRKIWRATPTEGLVLIDGVPAAMWRPKKSRDHLTLRVEPFDALTATEVEELNEEATLIAAHRGCTTVDVTIT
ncbi:MAG: winged helix DNA-binding domain-containing protein [Thermoleophilaceae bacterium]|nr:winged helix DNA-binding domain-containing protein [Thermoleophilaceae bacterium]